MGMLPVLYGGIRLACQGQFEPRMKSPCLYIYILVCLYVYRDPYHRLLKCQFRAHPGLEMDWGQSQDHDHKHWCAAKRDSARHIHYTSYRNGIYIYIYIKYHVVGRTRATCDSSRPRIRPGLNSPSTKCQAMLGSIECLEFCRSFSLSCSHVDSWLSSPSPVISPRLQ